MEAPEAVALGYCYPTPTSLGRLQEAAAQVADGSVRRALEKFIGGVGPLELGQWEELHTVTLDLSPLLIPYVGHVRWGDNYRRGEFMADLKRDMERVGVDLGGELPDHIEPILRYLAIASEPLDDLVEVLEDAARTMASTLDRAASDNPYRHLLDATVRVVADLTPGTLATPVAIGAKR